MNEDKLEVLASSGFGMPITTCKQAKDAGLQYYWTGKPCTKGHNSKRSATTNGCVACLYVVNVGRTEILTANQARLKAEQLQQRTNHLLSEKQRQKALEAFATSNGDVEKAARAVDLKVPGLYVQLAKSATFSAAWNTLERRINQAKGPEAAPPVYTPTDKKWTKEDREVFIRAYVDTGNIAAARDSVGASASNYFDEVETNEEFAAMVKVAQPKAAQALEEKAINMALNGNHQLLTIVLKAKIPEYKDKIQIDQTSTSIIKLSDDTLSTRIADLLNKHRVIDGEFDELRSEPVEPQGEGNPARLLGRVGQAEDSEQIRVHVSG